METLFVRAAWAISEAVDNGIPHFYQRSGRTGLAIKPINSMIEIVQVT
jgi:hypothetical protein